ncbi:TRAM domain-containing protein [Natrinema hispanicum]|uniref:Predicted RNA-binding protein, contains TRAM domain n=1 Tax=Natrinema hispanicum TaxID=392421 RepID=A0A1G6ZNJ7_9EURY|nr:TRAM domain-containing protein [Natrinema hispanicum]SDE03116.1 Predicted RNA-binding protein, contains TRAM domain [Natrinema hispanicum]SEU15263.1 Predicted RNA-binding protein, contains TRAM domain [Natrinema hispanicum]
MVEIPDSLRSLFSAPIEERNGTYVIEVPSSEVDHEALSADKTYRVAILESPGSTESSIQQKPQRSPPQETTSRVPSGPPVKKGEVRNVTIETVGDQGDGIAKVERGYVVIVPDAQPGDEPTVKIEQVQKNVAFASIVDSDPRTF